MRRPVTRRDRVLIGNTDVYRSGQLDAQILQNPIQGNCLLFGTRKPVQNESFETIRLAQALSDDTNGNFIRHQTAGVHIFFGFLAQFRTIFHELLEHISP